MEFIENFIPEHVIYALGLMLLHMLWQALIIAMLLGFVLIILRKSSPQSRYMAALSAFILIPVTAVITLISQWRDITFFTEMQSQYAALNTLQTSGGSNQTLIDSFLGLYVNYLPIIVFVWIIGVSALLLKSLGQLIVLQRLKNYYLKELGEPIKSRVRQIEQKFQIKKKVAAFISLRAKSPMIIGHLKPVLLLPETTVKSLSNDELHAILQHELAHIKRNDYIINLLQTLIEILFFFHPATWWISAIIRKEREECCDLYAIENEKDKLNLANALTAIQEIQLKSAPLAMSAVGNNNHLLKRIKNMFTNRPVNPSFKEGIIVTLFFVALVTFMSFILHEENPKYPKDGDTRIYTVNSELPNGKHMFAKIDENGEIQKLYVEGKKIPKRKYDDYQSAIDSLRSIEAGLDEVHANARKAETSAKEAESKAIEAEIQKTLAEINKNLTEEQRKRLHSTAGEDNDLASEIMSEISNSVTKELEKEFGENFKMSINAEEDGEKVVMRINGQDFIMDINDEEEKVVMRMDENGFVMDVNEDGEQVKMRFDSNGFYINVTENGKETVNIEFGPDGAVFNVDE